MKTTAKKSAKSVAAKTTPAAPTCGSCVYTAQWYPDLSADAVKASCPGCSPKSKASRMYSDDSTVREQTRKADIQSVWNEMSNEGRQACIADGTAPAQVLNSRQPKAVEQEKSTDERQLAKPVQKKPGVIAKIVEVLKTATKKKPVSKEQVLKVLVETFPDREERAMRSTIGSQMPCGLKVEKGIILETDGNGGWWIKQ